MDIPTREQRYQMWRDDFRAGKMDQAGFLAAVDSLAFQDEWGRYWMIGAESGSWYYYDGRAWQPAEPHQAGWLPVLDDQGRYWRREKQSGQWHCDDLSTEAYFNSNSVSKDLSASGQEVPAGTAGQLDGVSSPALPPSVLSTPSKRSYSALFMIPARSILAIGAAFVVVLLLLVWPVGGAPPVGGAAFAPSFLPALDAGKALGDAGSNRGGAQSVISGEVVDLSTGQPASGLQISVNGRIVWTDAAGSYSITGLPAGEYSVVLQLQGQGIPAQGPVFVTVDGQHSVTVNLTYYSQLQPLPTDTPQPLPVIPASVTTPDTLPPATTPDTLPPTTTPDTLPPAGASIAHRPLVMIGFGFLLALVGGAFFWKSLADERR